jgi:hypothetical protein
MESSAIPTGLLGRLVSLFFRRSPAHYLVPNTVTRQPALQYRNQALPVGEAIRLSADHGTLALVIANADDATALGCDALLLTATGELVRWSADSKDASLTVTSLGPSGLRYGFTTIATVGLDMFDGVFEDAFRRARALATSVSEKPAISTQRLVLQAG